MEDAARELKEDQVRKAARKKKRKEDQARRAKELADSLSENIVKSQANKLRLLNAAKKDNVKREKEEKKREQEKQKLKEERRLYNIRAAFMTHKMNREQQEIDDQLLTWLESYPPINEEESNIFKRELKNDQYEKLNLKQLKLEKTKIEKTFYGEEKEIQDWDDEKKNKVDSLIDTRIDTIESELESKPLNEKFLTLYKNFFKDEKDERESIRKKRKKHLKNEIIKFNTKNEEEILDKEIETLRKYKENEIFEKNKYQETIEVEDIDKWIHFVEQQQQGQKPQEQLKRPVLDKHRKYLEDRKIRKIKYDYYKECFIEDATNLLKLKKIRKVINEKEKETENAAYRFRDFLTMLKFVTLHSWETLEIEEDREVVRRDFTLLTKMREPVAVNNSKVDVIFQKKIMYSDVLFVMAIIIKTDTKEIGNILKDNVRERGDGIFVIKDVALDKNIREFLQGKVDITYSVHSFTDPKIIDTISNSDDPEMLWGVSTGNYNNKSSIMISIEGVEKKNYQGYISMDDVTKSVKLSFGTHENFYNYEIELELEKDEQIIDKALFEYMLCLRLLTEKGYDLYCVNNLSTSKIFHIHGDVYFGVRHYDAYVNTFDGVYDNKIKEQRLTYIGYFKEREELFLEEGEGIVLNSLRFHDKKKKSIQNTSNTEHSLFAWNYDQKQNEVINLKDILKKIEIMSGFWYHGYLRTNSQDHLEKKNPDKDPKIITFYNNYLQYNDLILEPEAKTQIDELESLLVSNLKVEQDINELLDREEEGGQKHVDYLIKHQVSKNELDQRRVTYIKTNDKELELFSCPTCLEIIKPYDTVKTCHEGEFDTNNSEVLMFHALNQKYNVKHYVHDDCFARFVDRDKEKCYMCKIVCVTNDRFSNIKRRRMSDYQNIEILLYKIPTLYRIIKHYEFNNKNYREYEKKREAYYKVMDDFVTYSHYLPQYTHFLEECVRSWYDSELLLQDSKYYRRNTMNKRKEDVYLHEDEMRRNYREIDDARQEKAIDFYTKFVNEDIKILEELRLMQNDIYDIALNENTFCVEDLKTLQSVVLLLFTDRVNELYDCIEKVEDIQDVNSQNLRMLMNRWILIMENKDNEEEKKKLFAEFYNEDVRNGRLVDEREAEYNFHVSKNEKDIILAVFAWNDMIAFAKYIILRQVLVVPRRSQPSSPLRDRGRRGRNVARRRASSPPPRNSGRRGRNAPRGRASYNRPSAPPHRNANLLLSPRARNGRRNPRRRVAALRSNALPQINPRQAYFPEERNGRSARVNPPWNYGI